MKNRNVPIIDICLLPDFFLFRIEDQSLQHPLCDCGLHIACGRTRIGAMNDEDRNYKYVSVLREHVTSDSICLCLSDGSLLGPLAARLGAKKVYCIDGNSLTRHVVEDYVRHNNLQDRVVILSSVQDLVSLMGTDDKVLSYSVRKKIKSRFLKP